MGYSAEVEGAICENETMHHYTQHLTIMQPSFSAFSARYGAKPGLVSLLPSGLSGRINTAAITQVAEFPNAALYPANRLRTALIKGGGQRITVAITANLLIQQWVSQIIIKPI
ncbi:hypothetical protein [Biostraticola tofi]|uniref:Uncharacterized protein n=1 Tax=Biostraticola tofi TaxID=466109 RepID=A0A4R3YRB9_9GAMM|nr:hypothetical protein [Biostraticola tofi]TCV93543.1 hypothetical protein EDC52_10999 [Biostraticola tofi]